MASDVHAHASLQGELATARAEQPYRLLVEAMDQGAVMLTAGTISYSNRRFAEIVRIPLDQIVGLSFARFVTSKPEPVWESFLVSAATSSTTVEIALDAADGSTVPTRISAHATDVNGTRTISLVVTDLSDILKAERARTERMDEEDAQKHREAELRESQRIARIGSWEWTIATGALRWSDGLNHLLARDDGAPAPTFEALPRFYTPDSWAQLGAVIARTIETGASYELELAMIRGDGTTCWTTTRGEAIRGADGTVVKLRGTVIDIDRRRQAEAKLRRSEARYRQIVETAQEGIWTIDSSQTVTFVNPRMASLLGYTVEEMVGAHLFDFMDDEAQAIARRSLERRQHGVKEHLELHYRRKDGTLMWASVTANPMVNADGSYLGALAMVSDISDRKRAEQTAEEQRRFSTAVIESLPGLFYVIDEQGRFLRWNKNLETVSGYSSEELSHMSALGLFKEADRSIVAERMREVFLAGESAIECALVAKDQTQAPYFFSGKRLLVDGKPCLVGLGIDFTVRKRLEADLRLQSAAFTAAAHAMVITDRTGAIEWLNPAFTALTGYTSDEVLGKNPGVLLKSGVHDQAFYKDLWDTVLGGHVWRGEMTNRRKDGRLYPEAMTITPVPNAAGEITHFVAIKQDLTAERQAEAKVLQLQKMEVVGRLAGGIAHDFNNLLTVINGTAELASRGLLVGDPRRADFEEIHRAGVRATSLTRQLLAFSRKQVLHPEILKLAHQVTGLRSMLQRVIGEDITLVVVGTADEEGTVKADAGQLEQVVMNLVVNARDAMPNGGVLTITIDNVELDPAQAAACECPPGPFVRLAIRDTGTGMDDVTRRRIFEPFFTTKAQGQGTGLGLATVYGIVAQSGGGLSVDSALGRGSTFAVYLPRVSDVAVASQPVVPPPAAAATGTILVVEDEDGVRHLAQRMLESFGYTVLTACDAADALRILEDHERPVHLMLTDVVMPRMSGPELAAWAATIRPETRVLFSSGHTDNAALRASVLDNGAHFIGKPYTGAELMRKVREMLDSKPTAESQAHGGRLPAISH